MAIPVLTCSVEKNKTSGDIRLAPLQCQLKKKKSPFCIKKEMPVVELPQDQTVGWKAL